MDANKSLSLIKDFLVESFEYLSTISEEITRLEKNPDDKELFNDIYRKFHTIKGSANLLSFNSLQEITHSTESLLDTIREGAIPLTTDIIDTLLGSVDCVTEILKNIETTGKESDKDYSELRESLLAAMEQNSISPKKQLMKDTKLFAPHLNEEEADKEIKKELETIISNPEKETTSTKEIKKEGEVKMEPTNEIDVKGTDRKVVDSVVRVDVNLLDKMMNVVGELVLNRNQILQLSNSIELPELHRLSQQLDAITTDLQSDIMTTRMQPIGGILNKFERIVRDMSKEFAKKINLNINGKETELDKTLLEAIKDPLTHMIRNAVDHGIETPEERKNQGKPEDGTISIRAYHEGGQVTIEIKDDGAGISRETIQNKGIQKSLISQDQATRMNDKQIFNLIFTPGFSTAAKVTNISGRGVGMDVVKTNVEKIGGSVEIDSTERVGTTFKLKIPLTLAIVPALIVKGGAESFAIPQANLVELVRLEGEKKLKLLENVQNSEFFRLRGELIPILRLNKSLKLNGKKDIKDIPGDDPDTNEILERDKVLNIVILNAEGCDYGLIVDTILDTEEIVVKPLSKQLRAIPVYAGATIMGDGRVALIIDAVGFAYNLHLGIDKKLDKTDSLKESILYSERQEFLLFNLSEVMYGVPLSLVNRLEEFPVENIEYTGRQKIIRYRDLAMPLIYVENALKLRTEENKENGSDKSVIPVFVIHIRNTYFGFIVNEIIDIAVTESIVNSDSVDRSGILGTVFIGDKTVTILDVYAILEHLNIGGDRNKGNGSLTKNKNKSKTILVVEDSPLYRKMNIDLFEEKGYHVLSAIDGKEGFDLLKEEEKVDLIVSDIIMPNMDGLEMARSIRKESRFKNLPMLALSTKADKKDVLAGEKAGFQYYLEKYNKTEILDTVEKILN